MVGNELLLLGWDPSVWGCGVEAGTCIQDHAAMAVTQLTDMIAVFIVTDLIC